MKKIILSAFTAALLLSTGCKSGGGDPKAVLANFFDALAKKDFTAAKKYSTKDSESMLGMVQMGMQNIPDTSGAMMYRKDNMEIGDAVISGDKATIPVKDKKSGESTDFTLRKESGDWKVAFDKSTLLEMAQKKMKEHGFNGMHKEGSMQTDSSITNGNMEEAQKMLDSAKKMLNDAKKNEK